jgi:hypothetical protein
VDRATEVDKDSAVAEDCRQELLSVAEGHRTAAQVARFAGDEVAVHRLVRAAVQQEEAAERCCPRSAPRVLGKCLDDA